MRSGSVTGWGLATLGLALLGTAAHAQDQTSTQTPSTNDETPTQVTVNGQRADVSDRIDRKVYDIAHDPDAKTGVAGDVLGKLPSVQVNPNGTVTLRGDAHVMILVDGKYPANGNQVVLTLSAADIDRIEVMTNPPAQYAPDGTAGIINIITKKRHPLGLNGNASLRLGTTGGVNGAASAVFTKGPWSIDSRLSVNHSPNKGDMRLTQDLPFTALSRGRFDGGADSALGNLNFGYKLSDTSTLTFESQAFTGHSKVDNSGNYIGGGRDYGFSGESAFHFGQADIEGIYDYNNDKSGSHFTLDADHTRYDNPSRYFETDTYSTGQAIFGETTRSWGPEDDIKGDYERHFAGGNELTGGWDWDHRITNIDKLYASTGTIAGPMPDGYRHGFVADRTVSAAYLTYQLDLGQWTALPGIRGEQERVRVTSEVADARTSALRWYPSLHLNRTLGVHSKLKLSYTRRVQRPEIAQYDPGVTFISATLSVTGNPYLKPANTDAYEAEYDYVEKTTSYEAAVYYHATSDLISSDSTVDSNGVVTTRPVNAGRSQSGGVELTAKAPLGGGFKYSLSLNLAAARTPLFAGGMRSYFSATSNGMLEYDTKGGDQYQVMVTATGRQYTPQGYTGASWRTDATWQRPLTRKLSLVVSAFDLFNSQRMTTVIDLPGLKSKNLFAQRNQFIRIGLGYKFGLKP